MGGGSAQGFSPRFFLSPADRGADRALAPGDAVVLDAEDSHHAARVLRLRMGDGCEVVTTAGDVFRAEVVTVREPVALTVVERLRGPEAGAVYRHEVGLVQALARPAVMDYVLEKGTEAGADFLLLVAAAGSPRHGDVGAARLERWRRIAREAAKQSKQTRVPRVDLVSSPAEALRHAQTQGHISIVLEPGSPKPLPEAVREAASPVVTAAETQPKGEPARAGLALWIGPEGGWETAELEALVRAGARDAHMGRSVLRTETAGPVAVAIARLALDDW